MTHPIIKTDNYILITSDEEIKEDCYAVHFSPLGEIELVTANGVCKLDKKVIAHLPLNNSSILEGVPLLPPFDDEFIQSLSQPKLPVEFKCEMVEFEVDMGLGEECIEYGNYPKIFKGVMQGEWIFE